MRKSWRGFFVRAIMLPCGLVPVVATAAPAPPPPVAIDSSSDDAPVARPQPAETAPAAPAALLPAAPSAAAALPPAQAEPTPAKPLPAVAAPEAAPKTLPPTGEPTPAAPRAVPTPAAPQAVPQAAPTPAAPRGAAAPAPTAQLHAPVAAPAPQAAAPPVADIRPAAFQGITPGQTTAEELVRILGKPAETIPANGTEILVYRPADFSRIEVVVADAKARSIVVHLKSPTAVDQLVRDLGFQSFQPVQVTDAEGRDLGVAFPERGMMFAFAPGSGQPLVMQLVLETISAESFLLRAEHGSCHNYTRALADLAQAERLGAPAERVQRRRAELLGETGQPTAALASIETALRDAPNSPQARLVKAKLLGEVGQYEQAIQEASAAIAAGDVAWQWKARGECLLAELLGAGPARDFEGALAHHRAAVKLASPLIGDSRPATRREAKEILARAHLAIAYDIASGEWRNKKEAVPKWLRKGGELVDDLVRTEGVDNGLRLHLYCQVVAAYSATDSFFDPASATDAALKEGRALMAASTDPAFQRVVEWKLGTTLTHVARLQRDRGQGASALSIADNAAAMVASAAKSREVSASRDYALAQLFYVIGSIHAIDKNEHNDAIAYYDKALALVSDPLPGTAEVRQGEHGEMLVSMGVSYWEAGQRERAVALTENGTKHIRRAIERGTFQPDALSVPYGNLANMHQQLGHQEQAVRFGEMSKRSAEAAVSTAAKEGAQPDGVKR